VIEAALLAVALAQAAPAGPARAEPLSVEAQVSKLEVRLGEPFEVAIEIRHRAEERYGLPSAPALPGALFQAEPRGCERQAQAAEAVTRCRVGFALFALGPQDTPMIPLRVETPGGEAVLEVAGLRVTGLGVLDPDAPPESLRLRDLAPPVPLRVRSLRLVFWTLGLAAAGLLAVFGWRTWRISRARRAAAGLGGPAPLSPEERLARRLDDLAALALGARGQGREHFFLLSEAVRAYLGARTGVPAPDLTSAEILDRLARAEDPRLDLVALRVFLEEADLVKFARAHAPAPACEAGLAFGRALLACLRPPPPAQAQAPGHAGAPSRPEGRPA
jgi:hypothetical protein